MSHDIGLHTDGTHTWNEVAEKLSRLEGKRLSRNAAAQSGERLLKKLREELIEDPVIKDWLAEKGLDGDLL